MNSLIHYLKSTRVVLGSFATLLLASCSSVQTINSSIPLVQENNLDYQRNQQALKEIKAFDLTGVVGIKPVKKIGASANFKFKQQDNIAYSANIIYPITGKQAKIDKTQYGEYIYTDSDGQTYKTYDYNFLSNALFKTYVPLDILSKIILAQPVEQESIDGKTNDTIVIQNGVISSQNYKMSTNIKYSDFRLIDNKYLIPFLINIEQFGNLVKIKLNDDAHVIDGELQIKPEVK